MSRFRSPNAIGADPLNTHPGPAAGPADRDELAVSLLIARWTSATCHASYANALPPALAEEKLITRWTNQQMTTNCVVTRAISLEDAQ